MKKYDEILLNKLLDSYESSALYTGNNKNNQSIFFSFNKKNIPEYFSEQSSIYDVINKVAETLEYKGFVNIRWKNKREGYIIEKLILNTIKIDEIYSYLNRNQKKNMENSVLRLLMEYSNKDKILNAFTENIIKRINENKSIKKYFELDNLIYIENLLKAVHAVVVNKEEIYIRELSIKLFNDSKLLESLETKIKNIILEFQPENGYYNNIENLFGEFNILKNPSFVMIKGVGKFKVNNTVIDLKDFINGIGISSGDLKALEFPIYKEVKKLITIENLTAFNRYTDENSIIIYLGGYHNEIRRELLKKIYLSNRNIQFYHWGDIDCGGFRIFNHLTEKTGIPFLPIKMDTNTLKKYINYVKPLTSTDVASLKIMEEKKEFNRFKETINFMLRNNVKLEQEIVY